MCKLSLGLQIRAAQIVTGFFWDVRYVNKRRKRRRNWCLVLKFCSVSQKDFLPTLNYDAYAGSIERRLLSQ